MPVHQAIQVEMEMMVPLVHKVHLVHLDLRARKEEMVLAVTRDDQLCRQHPSLGILVHLENRLV